MSHYVLAPLVIRHMTTKKTGIAGCEIVPVSGNRDARGCLYEIYRQSWPNAFVAVQWNACASGAGVVRGAHVHVDYDEFYTLPQGRVVLGLADIRKESPTFKHSAQIDWADKEDFAVLVPRGVVHVVLFNEDSVLALGLSGYWRAELDIVGCQWDDPELGFAWPDTAVHRSQRDVHSGGYTEMLLLYEELSYKWSRSPLSAR
ncbi:MAG: dTDP-4-dehydrorhamnose 3,5-epimerase family protein [bacterium]